MQEPKIIALSGASGCGKTTIIKALVNQFECPFLLFDDHTNETTYPKDMKLWYQNGADVSEIKTPKFIDAVEQLTMTSKTSFIFIEEPFGKQRSSISPLIDHVILLDTPLEICLSRVIKRHLNKEVTASASLLSYLNKYEDYFRDIYANAVDQVRDNCDLSIDRITSIELTTNLITEFIQQRY